MSQIQKILIMAGGTGGHVFPGIALAKYFQQHGIEVHWLGTPKGLEAKLIVQEKLPLHFISISGIRGKSFKDKCLMPMRLFLAIKEATKIIKNLNPDIVIGMGGFVSGPGGIASWLLKKKLVIHEQNATPGLTNKYLAKIATKVLQAFPNTFQTDVVNNKNKLKKIFTTGNPIRKELENLNPPIKRLNNRKRMHLLVLGGSLGAKAINELMPKVLSKLSPEVRPLIMHQSGEQHFTDTLNAYKTAAISAEIVPFIQSMDKAYDWADFVICRAGALTIAELCAVGLGAILIPYPYAIDDHQTANANYMVGNGAGLLIKQHQLTVEGLAETLKGLALSVEKRLKMAEAAYKLRQTDATKIFLNICEEICH